MKKLLISVMLLLARPSLGAIDTTSLFPDTEKLRTYCEKKCLNGGDCVEKCMNLDQEDTVNS